MEQTAASTTYIGARVPIELATSFERIATREDRTVSGELRRVIRQHVAEREPGSESVECEEAA